jgi:DNA-directed RNA polymerase specialized sigma24 family protein
MTDEAKKIPINLNQVDLLALRPLTRIKQTATAVQRAERALHDARVAHADAIIAAHDAGHSYAQIGTALGISRGRVHQLVQWRAEQKQSKRGRQHG